MQRLVRVARAGALAAPLWLSAAVRQAAPRVASRALITVPRIALRTAPLPQPLPLRAVSLGSAARSSSSSSSPSSPSSLESEALSAFVRARQAQAEGRLDEAHASLMQAQRAFERVYGTKESAGAAAVHHALGSIATMRNDLDAAAQHYDDALATLARVHGTKTASSSSSSSSSSSIVQHADVLPTLYERAIVDRMRGQPQAAEHRLRDALRVAERVYAGDADMASNASFSMIKSALAVTVASLRPDDAEPLLREALEGHSRAHERAVRETRAQLQQQQQPPAEAERVFPALEAMMSGTRATLLEALGAVLERNGQLNDALACHEEILTSLLPPVERSRRATQLAAVSLMSAGRLAQVLHRLGDAEAYLSEAMTMFERLRGTRDSFETVAALCTLARVDQQRGQLERAEPRLRDAADMLERMQGTRDTAEIAFVRYSLGTIVGGRGDYAEAERLLRSAVSAYESAMSPDELKENPMVPRALVQLGNAVRAGRGDLDEAERHIERGLAMMRECSFASAIHEGERLQPVFSLALLAAARADVPRAERLLRETIEMGERVHGTRACEDVVLGLRTLAAVLQNAGRHEEARVLLDEAAELAPATPAN